MHIYRRKRRSSGVFSLLLVVAGLAVMGYTLFGHGPSSAGDARASTPALNQTMSLTVPAMSRVSDIPVYTGPANSPELDTGALHLQGTGFPWQSGSNTYIAGHRLGYPNTGSFLVFRDLNKLNNGDQVILTSNGTTYTYTVFREFVVSPNDQSVTQPVPGKTVVSLQTCTLPNFTDRLIVQAELTSVN